MANAKPAAWRATSRGLHTSFALVSAALYTATLFILLHGHSAILATACLALSVLTTAQSFGLGLRRCAMAGGVSGVLMAAAVLGAVTGGAAWAWSLVAALGGVYLGLWSAYRCPAAPRTPRELRRVLARLHRGWAQQ